MASLRAHAESVRLALEQLKERVARDPEGFTVRERGRIEIWERQIRVAMRKLEQRRQVSERPAVAPQRVSPGIASAVNARGHAMSIHNLLLDPMAVLALARAEPAPAAVIAEQAQVRSIPLEREEALSITLDTAFPKAASKLLVEYTGRRYIRRYRFAPGMAKRWIPSWERVVG